MGARVEPDHVPPGNVSLPHAIVGIGISEVATDRLKGERPTELFWIHPRLIDGRAADIETT